MGTCASVEVPTAAIAPSKVRPPSYIEWMGGPLIEVEGVTKAFGATVALNDVHIQAERGTPPCRAGCARSPITSHFSVTVTAARGLLDGEAAAHYVWLSVAWSCGIVGVLFALACLRTDGRRAQVVLRRAPDDR